MRHALACCLTVAAALAMGAGEALAAPAAEIVSL